MRSYTLYTLLVFMLIFSSCDIVNDIAGQEDSNNNVELFPVELNGRWGYINQSGQIAIEPDFQSARPFSDGLAVIRDGNRWRYINSKGDVVIDLSLNNASNFSEGKAAVQFDGRWGYINKSGKFTVNPRFRSAYAFSNDRAFVRSIDYSEYYYINGNGDKVEAIDLPSGMDFVEANQFIDGRAMIRDNDLYGYIDKNGNPIIDLKYAEARPFSDKLAAVRISDRWAFINGDGEVVISPQYISVGDFGDGLAPFRRNSNSFGYINRKGEVAIEEQFEQAEKFSEGRAAVMINGQWTFIDTNGNQITSRLFDEVRPFENGLARVTVLVPVEDEFEEEYGYINRDGVFVWFPTN